MDTGNGLVSNRRHTWADDDQIQSPRPSVSNPHATADALEPSNLQPQGWRFNHKACSRHDVFIGHTSIQGHLTISLYRMSTFTKHTIITQYKTVPLQHGLRNTHNRHPIATTTPCDVMQRSVCINNVPRTRACTHALWWLFQNTTVCSRARGSPCGIDPYETRNCRGIWYLKHDRWR